jgi:hypothetical protein
MSEVRIARRIPRSTWIGRNHPQFFSKPGPFRGITRTYFLTLREPGGPATQPTIISTVLALGILFCIMNTEWYEFRIVLPVLSIYFGMSEHIF